MEREASVSAGGFSSNIGAFRLKPGADERKALPPQQPNEKSRMSSPTGPPTLYKGPQPFK
nr:MAG TPA: hypothetical protein [Caudoviricetes sp.]